MGNVRRKSLESAFAGEFHQYVSFKQGLLENKDFLHNERTKQLMDNMPPEMRNAAVPFLQAQIEELKGKGMTTSTGIFSGRSDLMDYLAANLPEGYGLTREQMQQEYRDVNQNHDIFVSFLESVLPSHFQVYRGEFKEYCTIRGVTDEYFGKFNGELVVLQPRISYKKAVVGNDGHLLKNSLTGEYSTIDVDIPQGSRVITCSTNVEIPTTVTQRGRTVPYYPPDGYGFIAGVAERNYYALLITEEPITGMRELIPLKQYDMQFNNTCHNLYMYLAPYTGIPYARNSLQCAVRQDCNYMNIVSQLESHWRMLGLNYAVTRDILTDRMQTFNETTPDAALFTSVEKSRIQPMYYFPREHIWRKNLCALLLTRRRLTQQYYWGRKYTFNKGIAFAYLYVVPFTKNLLNDNNVVFCVKPSSNYNEEIQQLEAYWRRTTDAMGNACASVLYQAHDTEGASADDIMDDNMENNLSYRTLPTPDIAPFEPVGKSLADGDEDLVMDVMSDDE